MVTFVWVRDLVVLAALASAGSLNVTIKGHMTQKEVPILNGCDPGMYEVKVYKFGVSMSKVISVTTGFVM